MTVCGGYGGDDSVVEFTRRLRVCLLTSFYGLERGVRRCDMG